MTATGQPPQPLFRIVILTLDSLQSGVALHRLLEALGGRVVAIVASRRYGGKYGSFLAQTRRNHARSGMDFVNYLGLQMLWFHPMAMLAGGLNRLRGRKSGAYRLSALARHHRIPVISTADPNSPEIIAKLKALAPDLVVSMYFDHVIRAPLIAIPGAGVINVHPALLPDLRGPFPGLWTMIHDAPCAGITVHRITDETLDTGAILAQREVPRDPDESVLALDCRLMRLGAGLVAETIRGLEQGTVMPMPQPAGGSYDSYPTRKDIAALKSRGKRLWSLSDFVRQFFALA